VPDGLDAEGRGASARERYLSAVRGILVEDPGRPSGRLGQWETAEGQHVVCSGQQQEQDDDKRNEKQAATA
jgi:hypothetical protein